MTSVEEYPGPYPHASREVIDAHAAEHGLEPDRDTFGEEWDELAEQEPDLAARIKQLADEAYRDGHGFKYKLGFLAGAMAVCAIVKRQNIADAMNRRFSPGASQEE